MSDAYTINGKLEEYLQDIGLQSSDSGGKVVFSGADPILHSRIRLGACLAIPAAACGVGAAAIWKDRTGSHEPGVLRVEMPLAHENVVQDYPLTLVNETSLDRSSYGRWI